MEEGGYSGRRVTFLCDARYQLPGYAPQTGHLAPTPSFRDGYVDDCMSGLMTCAFQGVKLVVEIAPHVANSKDGHRLDNRRPSSAPRRSRRVRESVRPRACRVSCPVPITASIALSAAVRSGGTGRRYFTGIELWRTLLPNSRSAAEGFGTSCPRCKLAEVKILG